MTLNIDGNYKARVQIRDTKDNLLYQRKFSSDDAVRHFILQYGTSKEGWSLMRGIFTPIRTENCKDFAKDFFLPTFINFATKINNLGVKIIVSFFAICLDLVALPIRFFATPFRMSHNSQNQELDHPLIALIQENSLSKSYPAVQLMYTIEKRKTTKGTYLNPDDLIVTKIVVKGSRFIALQRMPGFIKKASESESTSNQLFNDGGVSINLAGNSQKISHHFTAW